MLTLAMPLDAKPVCADPEYLPLVDAAFAQPGGDDSRWIRDHLCPNCPVRLECLLLGNAKGEHGVWGGLNGNERTRAGGRSTYGAGGWARNLAGVQHR